MGSQLSVIDAFFVAYHEATPALMQIASVFWLEGPSDVGAVERALHHVLGRWPQLGQRLHVGAVGLSWVGAPSIKLTLCDSAQRFDEALNASIDPFNEAPFKLIYYQGPDDEPWRLGFVVHHALMDGEGLIGVSRYFSHVLSCALAAQALPEHPERFFPAAQQAARSSGGKLSLKALGSTWRYKRWLEQESSQPRGLSLKLKDACAAPLRTHNLYIALDALERLSDKHRVRPSWLVLAAWFRALWRWQTMLYGPTPSLISMEIAYSERSALADPCAVGNHVAPLLLLQDASAPLEDLARALKAQYKEALAAGGHKATAIWSAPGALLPWAVFKRVAVDPKNTGSATSHFVWFDASESMTQTLAPSLSLAQMDIYTPVCMGMGVSACAVRWPEHLQLALTYRTSAFDAEQLSALVACLEECFDA